MSDMNNNKKPLPAKEAALFKHILKQFEHKQYKKGLKGAEQILKKVPDHGESLAMKGLFLHYLDQKSDGFEFVKKGLRQDLFSPICWHVFGLMHRSDKNYEEAMKCYKNALKYDKENVQVLRDFSILQVQMRNYEGFNESQHELLRLRPNQRAFWIGLAISFDLLNNFDMAIKVIDAYEQTLKERPSEKLDYEHSELMLYKKDLFLRNADYTGALNHLDKCGNEICDKTELKHSKARILLLDKQFELSARYYIELIELNPERVDYLEGLRDSRGLEDFENDIAIREKYALLLEKFHSRYPKSNCIYLTLLSVLPAGEKFSQYADMYLQKMIRKGVPSLFVLIKKVYEDPEKISLIEKLMKKYLDNLSKNNRFDNTSGDPEPPSCLMWMKFFLAQHYDKIGDFSSAIKFIDQVLEHTPTLLEACMLKARFFKHAGDYDSAAQLMDDARLLDLQDRYINSKATKYFIRNNQIEQAEKTIGVFAKQGTQDEKMNDLVDMQCMWFAIECALSLKRQGKYKQSLEKFKQIFKHFNDITDDQFDFHSYCLRKMTLRYYLDLIKFENKLRSHEYYVKAAINAAECYLALEDSSDQTNEEISENGIDEALKALEPIQNLCFEMFDVHRLSFSIYMKRKKFMLAFKSLQHAVQLDPKNPKLIEMISNFQKNVYKNPKAMESQKELVNKYLNQARNSNPFLEDELSRLSDKLEKGLTIVV